MAILALTGTEVNLPSETTWTAEVISWTPIRVTARDHESGTIYSFVGTNIAFDANGDVQDGMITGLRVIVDNVAIATFDHDPIAAVTLAQTVESGGFLAYAQLAMQGNDTIRATYGGNDWLIGFGGNDTIVGGGGDDMLDGDYVGETAFGNDTISGDDGNDTIRGLSGDDIIYGQSGADDVNGNQGADTLYGGEEADYVRGGQGDDLLYGNGGDDVHLNGNLGNDIVYGGIGNDFVFGGQGDDRLFGEAGNDIMSGDLGNDTLTGGDGADRFLMTATGGNDVVTDFSFSAGDRVMVPAGSTFTIGASGGQATITFGASTLTLSGIAAGTATASWVAFGA